MRGWFIHHATEKSPSKDLTQTMAVMYIRNSTMCVSGGGSGRKERKETHFREMTVLGTTMAIN